MPFMRFRKLLCLIPLYLQSIAAADVQLSALFSDHMVLQRDRPITVWGWGSPGEKVQVSLTSSDPTRTEVAQDGKWTCTLNPLPASTKPLELKVSATNEILLKNILIGDVWLCSGQSNMEWGLGGCDAPEDIRSANFPLIRHFGVETNFASTPQPNVKGRWNVCKPENAP